MTVSPIVAPSLLRLGAASDDQQRLIGHLTSQLARVNTPNRDAEQFYDGSHVAQQFGISIPPSMQDVHTVAGWGGTVVDVLEERLDWHGWTSDADDFGLGDIYLENQLDVDSGLAHLDSLIFGVSYVTVGTGDAGEPSPLITPQSPTSMFGVWDRRLRRLSAALAVSSSRSPITGLIDEVTLYEPRATSVFALDGGVWRTKSVDDHKLDRVPVAMMPNRIRGSRDTGRSEITKAVRYYTEAACRTLLGLEVNREFYNAPQRVGLNIDERMFQDEAGNPISQWTSIMGRVWNVPPMLNDQGEPLEGGPQPDIKQFSAASPAPYVDQIEEYATQLAAEAGIPAAYLGLRTDNPASADAIRALEARLVKRAERRQAIFGRAWLEVGRLALLVRDGVVPDSYGTSVATRWRDAATPTRAAAADEAVKLIGSGALPPDSSVTYDRIGLSPAEQRQVASDKRRARAVESYAGLQSPASSRPGALQ